MEDGFNLQLPFNGSENERKPAGVVFIKEASIKFGEGVAVFDLGEEGHEVEKEFESGEAFWGDVADEGLEAAVVGDLSPAFEIRFWVGSFDDLG